MREIASVTPSWRGVTYARAQGKRRSSIRCSLRTRRARRSCSRMPFPRPTASPVRSGRVPPAGRAAGRRVSLRPEHRPSDVPLAHRHDDAPLDRLDSREPTPMVEINPAGCHRAGRGRGRHRAGDVPPRLDADRGPGLRPPGAEARSSSRFHFREAAANLLTNPQLDPYAKIAEFKISAVRVEPVREPAFADRRRTALSSRRNRGRS